MQKVPEMSELREKFGLDTLPIEVLVRVLGSLRPRDLGQVAQVCKSLQAASNEAYVSLTFLDLKNPGATLTDARCAVLLSRLGPKLKKLELDCWHLSDEALKCLPEGIEELVLCGCDHHSNAILSYVTERTHSSLRRFAWSGFGGSVSASGFEKLAFRCRKLTSFKIDSGNAMDVNGAVRSVIENCPLLTELSAYDLTRYTFEHMNKCGISLKKLRHKRRERGAMPLTDITLFMITITCPLLEELHLADKIEPDGFEDVTDAGLLFLAERAPTLRILKLKLANPMTARRCSEVAVMELASRCSKLTHVELSNFRKVSDPPIYEFVQKCPRLVEVGLNYTSITNASLELMSQHCKKIRSVSFKGCRKLNEAGLKALGECGSLEAVNAGQTSGLTDATVSVICSGNASLKSLVLSYAPLTDDALKSIATRPEMQELAIHGCSQISNDGLRLIAKGCPRLRYISMSYCDHISDSGIVSLANGCPQLLKVRLDGCRLLSEPSVRALCQKAPKLRYLSMRYCVKLSDFVFQHLLCAAAIRFVDLGKAKLTSAAMAAFLCKRPFVDLFIDGKPSAMYTT